VGNDVASFWESLKEGKGGVGPTTSFDATAFDSRIAAEVKNFDPLKYGISLKEIKRTAKFVQYAVAAAKEAVESSGLDLNQEDRDRIGVIIGWYWQSAYD